MLLESRYIVTIKPFMLLCASMLQIYTCFINFRVYAYYVYMDCCKHASYICLHVWTSYSVLSKNYYMVPIFSFVLHMMHSYVALFCLYLEHWLLNSPLYYKNYAYWDLYAILHVVATFSVYPFFNMKQAEMKFYSSFRRCSARDERSIKLIYTCMEADIHSFRSIASQ
jgi:hypothetical protein